MGLRVLPPINGGGLEGVCARAVFESGTLGWARLPVFPHDTISFEVLLNAGPASQRTYFHSPLAQRLPAHQYVVQKAAMRTQRKNRHSKATSKSKMRKKRSKMRKKERIVIKSFHNLPSPRRFLILVPHVPFHPLSSVRNLKTRHPTPLATPFPSFPAPGSSISAQSVSQSVSQSNKAASSI